MKQRNVTKYQLGFSMLEMAVSVSIALIIGGFAVSNYASMRVTFNKADAINQLREDLRIAQLESVSEGGRGVLAIASDGLSYSFGYDYLPYDKTDPIEPDTVRWLSKMPKYTKIETNKDIIFNSQGNVIDKDGVLQDVEMTLYDTHTETDVIYQSVILSTTGVLNFED